MPKIKEPDIFAAIQADDLGRVQALIAGDPSLVSAVAPKRPVGTKGMSPLQVSLTTGWHCDIVDFLLDHGADVNYMEGPEWHVPQAHPVLHDAVSVAIWNSRRYAYCDPGDPADHAFEWKHTRAEADRAYALFSRMLEMGADVNAVNRYNDNALEEAVKQANYCCPARDFDTGQLYPSPAMTPEMTADFQRIFRRLLQAGASTENRNSFNHKTIREFYEPYPEVWSILEPVLREFGPA